MGGRGGGEKKEESQAEVQICRYESVLVHICGCKQNDLRDVL